MPTQTVDAMRLLDNVTIPNGLNVIVTNDTDQFMNLKGQLNTSTTQYFGTAFRQGNRLQFATAMAIRDYCSLVRVDQADKGSTLEETREHMNRPKEKAHGKAIGQYLSDTACQGLPFIFPSFLLNYGIGYTDDRPPAHLVIFAGQRDSLAWPAIFTPPVSDAMPVTDGGHRTDEINAKLKAAAGRMPENALSIIFVFEADEDMYHQDFADCAKAKAISKSLAGSWDRRDAAKKFGVDLVENNQYLRKLVDATSNSVNLSTNSTKAWSMSALQAGVTSLYALEKNPKRLSDYIDELFHHIPILVDVANGGSPAKHRNADRGGCVLLRGVGFAVLMQAYLYGVQQERNLADIAAKLAEVDWYVLKPNAEPQADDEDAHTYTARWAQPIWVNMLAMLAGDRAFRIKGHKLAAETSFTAIRAQLGL